MFKDTYVSAAIAKKKLGVCSKTLRVWSDKKKIETIRTPGGWRKYNISKYMAQKNLHERKKICYARVSSYDQKKDLANQVHYLTEKYPDHELIKDIGSGINFKRKGLQKLIHMAINNELDEVVITYKDRLCRIGYDLISFIFTKYSSANIVIENVEDKQQQQEITEDLMEIITVYSSRLYGARSGKKSKKV